MSVPVIPLWPFAYGGPCSTGQIKSAADDFIVEERLGFMPEGGGEHQFLYIRSTGDNTEYISRLLARHAGVRQRDIGYAGMKDRHGRTSQWFSVWLPGKEGPDWTALEHESFRILQMVRHSRKLKRGVLAGNRFEITVRNWQGDTVALESKLQRIEILGFPNYFGEQRFGREGRNLQKALDIFSGGKARRQDRVIYWSAARAFLFNQVLAARVRAHTWNKALTGDILNLAGSNSRFSVVDIDQELRERVEKGDVHPTGALFGIGDSEAEGEVLTVERQVAASYPTIVAGLADAGLESDRRPLRAMAEDLVWRFLADDRLHLSFGLSAGSYATALLREIVQSPQIISS